MLVHICLGFLVSFMGCILQLDYSPRCREEKTGRIYIALVCFLQFIGAGHSVWSAMGGGL